jgi:Mrp family chromosome partitioning ATPase
MAASRRFGEILNELAAMVDLVIVDTPPLLEVGDAGAIAARADGVLFVVNMGKVRWPMLERSHAQLMKFPCRKLGSVVVAAKRVRKPAYGYEYRGAPSSNDEIPPSLI